MRFFVGGAIVALALRAVVAEPSTATSAESFSAPALHVKEEPFDEGTRMRVSTSEVVISSTPARTLNFHVECLHPVGKKETPSQCLIYMVVSSKELLYPDHDTPFAVVIDGSAAFQRPFKNFKVLHDGDSIIEPLISFWQWDNMKAFAQAKAVQFKLANEVFDVPNEAITGLKDMVRYFGR